MSDERRHAPTAARLREAHQQGHFAKSRELTAACVLLSVALVAPVCISRLRIGLKTLFQSSYSSPVRTVGDLEQLASRVDGIGPIFLSVALLAAAVISAAILGNAMQSGFRFGFRLPGNRFATGNSQFRSIAARTSGAASAWLRFAACGITGLWTCVRELPAMSAWNGLPTRDMATEWGSLLSVLSWRLGLVLLSFAILDYGLARRRFTRGLAMTDEELRRESASNRPANRRQVGRRNAEPELRVHQAVET